MKTETISKLPDGCFFYRKGYREKWLKLDQDFVRNTEFPTDVIPLTFEHEVILIDPFLCDYCMESFRPFLPVTKCISCGASLLDRNSIAEIKKKVMNWTGQDEPHL